MVERVNLDRCGLVTTKKCTLKCKLCGGYIPEYKNSNHYDLTHLTETIDNFFGLIDYVQDFSITGGEPLLRKDLNKIIEKTLEYSSKIGRLLILTNGTILPKEDTLDVLKNNSEKCFVTVSNYGDRLSRRADDLKALLEENLIPHRIINYSGDDLFCDGWVDYGDHSQQHFTIEERDEKGKSCAIRTRHVSIIMDGQFHSCGRSFRRMELGVIPRDKKEYVDLFDDTRSDEEKRETIMDMYNAVSTTACAYCNGLRSDSERFPPAEQY